jgi:hypothetical protein
MSKKDKLMGKEEGDNGKKETDNAAKNVCLQHSGGHESDRCIPFSRI